MSNPGRREEPPAELGASRVRVPDPHALAEHTARLVGIELRRLRHERGWSSTVTSERLAAATGHEVSMQMILAYEKGHRGLSVERLVALCYTLGVRPAALWSTVDSQVFGTPADAVDDRAIQVDLRKVAEIPGADLEPARAWARTQLNCPATGTTTVLTFPAVTSLATVCGLDVADVTAALRATSTTDPTEPTDE